MRSITLCAFVIGILLGTVMPSQARSVWPAGKVDFTDAENLQQKFDAGDLGGGGANVLDDLITTADCGTPTANEVLITAASGLHHIPSTSGCIANDTIVIPDFSTFDADAALSLAIINDSGVGLLVDASANTGGIVNEATSNVIPAGATFSVVQTAASTVHLIGTGAHTSANQTIVLLGGIGGIADVANPNDVDADGVFDDELICSQADADCLYLSTTTGWWAAITSNGSTETTWSPMQEQRLHEFQIEGDAGYNTDTYSGTDCIRIRDVVEATSMIVCTDENAKISWSRDVFITSWSWTARDGFGNPVSQSATDGCVAKLVTGISGGTDITNGEIKVPPTETDIPDGKVYASVVGQTLPAGDSLLFKIRDGDFCENGTGPITCKCGGSWGYSKIEIWGLIQ